MIRLSLKDMRTRFDTMESLSPSKIEQSMRLWITYSHKFYFRSSLHKVHYTVLSYVLHLYNITCINGIAIFDQGNR